MLPAGFSASGLKLRIFWPRDRPPPRRHGMSSFMRTAGYRLTSAGQDVDEISSADRQRSACRPDEVNDVGVELDPRCGQHQRCGQASGSPTPVPRTTSSRGAAGRPWYWGSAGSGPLPLRDDCLCVVGTL